MYSAVKQSLSYIKKYMAKTPQFTGIKKNNILRTVED